MKKSHQTKNAPKAVGPYSQAIEANGFLFTSGQIHLTPEGDLLNGSIEDKTRQVMNNLKAVLKKAGLSFDDVVKTEIYLTDLKNYQQVNEVYGSFLSEPFPARVTVGVKELPAQADIEISMIASLK